MQVEHAHLTYQKSRLSDHGPSRTPAWRLRFVGGPARANWRSTGPDRERIVRIEDELEKVKRRRKLHRDSRARVPYPIAALVGYTNAGNVDAVQSDDAGKRAASRHAVCDA